MDQAETLPMEGRLICSSLVVLLSLDIIEANFGVVGTAAESAKNPDEFFEVCYEECIEEEDMTDDEAMLIDIIWVFIHISLLDHQVAEPEPHHDDDRDVGYLDQLVVN